jgi:L-asparaginase
MLLKHVKNPIKLAKEMLIRGERDDGGGAGMHSQLSGEALEKLAAQWGLDMVDQKYFFTQKRWDEHTKGLEREEQPSEAVMENAAEPVQDGNVEVSKSTWSDPSWDGHEYLPQGTVGAVVLDRFGVISVATSTGGLTNKLPGRIGDTPTLGAGFWAEEWTVEISRPRMHYTPQPPLQDMSFRGETLGLLSSCLPALSSDVAYPSIPTENANSELVQHAIGMSGTGNGDSFLRVAAARTAAAMSRFSPNVSLAQAVHAMAGPGGELQNSAGERFGKTGEGEGGIIGVELVGFSTCVVQSHNCGGMFRAWIDDAGKHRFIVFKDN